MNEEEFEKQQLEQLISELKDIDKYTSFKNGAFIYDLGKYQGSLLVNHINNLQSKIDKAIEYCKYNDEGLYTFEPDYDYEENMVDNYEPSSFREDIMEILKEDK